MVEIKANENPFCSHEAPPYQTELMSWTVRIDRKLYFPQGEESIKFGDGKHQKTRARQKFLTPSGGPVGALDIEKTRVPGIGSSTSFRGIKDR